MDLQGEIHRALKAQLALHHGGGRGNLARVQLPPRLEVGRKDQVGRVDAGVEDDAVRAQLELEVAARVGGAGRQEDLDDLLGPERGVALPEGAPGGVVNAVEVDPQAAPLEDDRDPGRLRGEGEARDRAV